MYERAECYPYAGFFFLDKVLKYSVRGSVINGAYPV
jgi:hypothetical protein